MFNKDSLHHAYFITGDKKSALLEVESFLKEAFNLSKEGHPDVHYFEYLSLGIDESRNLQNMQSMKPILGDKKIFIISLNTITNEAQNSLLKVFEEPTSGTHFFIISSSEKILLPTLRSRMVIISNLSVKNLHKNFDKEEIKKFINMTPKNRLAYVSYMIENKDKVQAEEFLQTLVSFRPKSIREILILIDYIKDRASSPKLILERVAFLDL